MMQHKKDKYLRIVYGEESMDTAKFLRALADFIEAAQTDATKTAVSGSGIQSDETDVMVPPLQQEIELMKKATNVDSVFDDTEKVKGEEPEQEAVEVGAANGDDDNELTILKKNAGLGLGLTDESVKR